MSSPQQSKPEDGGQRGRRERLLAEIFRNALALAIMKQALIGGSSVAEGGQSEPGTEDGRTIPSHLEG